ncbi:MAG: DUF4159 domain-containing protein [Pirellulaceae bacterium]|nr:DUF4159 domain-containing protein [Pirellulaceae bacterium]
MKSLFRLAGSIIGAMIGACVLVSLTAGQAAFAGNPPFQDELNGEQVRQSIQRGVRYLLNERGGDGYWRENATYIGGVPALVVLALLNSGVDANSPELREPIRRLATEAPRSTYASSLIVMVLAEADPVRYRPQIRQHIEFVISKQADDGGFGYGHGGEGWTDSSNSQFAILALHEAQLAGVDIDRRIWQRAQGYWEKAYNGNEGSFSYRTNATSHTGSMTCAGVCSAVLVAENLQPGASAVNGNQVSCCQTPPKNRLVDGGLTWLARHFTVDRNPTVPMNDPHASALYYYLYSLERTGRITGRRFIGKHDWYRAGTKELLSRQKLNGGWGSGGGFGESDPLVTSSMALLFLSKGLRPILIGKYQHGDGNHWDPHPQGVHLLTRYVEKAWTRKLNWQTIEGIHAKPDDLMEAPVLYITGDRRLKLSFEQIANLKKYVDNGGFLFIESQNGFGCPSAKLFDQDVRELLSVLYPDTKLEVLKPEHAVWNSHFPLNPDQDFPLLGIQSCCRTSVIYCPGPLSGFWELNRPKQQEYGDAVRQKINYSVQLGTNILAFATGNELKDKLDRPKLEGDERLVKNMIGRRILVPKLRHRSGFDDAPMALANLLRRVNNDRGVQFETQAEFVDADLESLLDYPLVFVHGRGKFSLSEQEREALKIHLQRGGFIFGDAICGDKPFAESFRQEMQNLIPDTTWEALEKTDYIYTARYGGYDIAQVQMRLPNAPGAQATGYVPTDPKLEALRVGDRYRIIFSPFDISCALESGTSSSCYGYSVEDAARIAANVLLYSLHP